MKFGFVCLLAAFAAGDASADDDVATMGLQLDSGETILRIEAHNFPNDKHRPVFAGYMGAYFRTLSCRYLRDNHADLREDLLDSYLNDVVVLKYVADLDGDCARTEGWSIRDWWWVKVWTNVAQMAFTRACAGTLTSTLFHEMIHRESVGASEELVTEIEKRCEP